MAIHKRWEDSDSLDLAKDVERGKANVKTAQCDALQRARAWMAESSGSEPSARRRTSWMQIRRLFGLGGVAFVTSTADVAHSSF